MSFEYYNQKIGIVGKKNYFINYQKALVREINSYGFNAIAYNDVDLAVIDGVTVLVVICPQLFRKPKEKNILWIAIQTEQMYNPNIGGNEIFGRSHMKDILPILKKYDVILDWSIDNVDILTKYLKKCYFFPYSYFKELEIADNKPNDEKEYDICFIGNMPGVDNRRKEILEKLQQKYKCYPIRNDLWGGNKTLALKSAKIYLNIHFEESRCMESPRIYDYIANRCFVLSEPMHNPYPFVVGKDYDDFYISNMFNKTDYYLKYDEKRLQIVNTAYETLNNIPLRDTVKQLLDIIILESYKKQFK